MKLNNEMKNNPAVINNVNSSISCPPFLSSHGLFILLRSYIIFTSTLHNPFSLISDNMVGHLHQVEYLILEQYLELLPVRWHNHRIEELTQKT